MANQIAVLKLVLDELGLDQIISTMDDRIEIQKAVCLIQEGGLHLGYSYNWYVRGPYSPSLASDYYALAQADGSTTANLVLTDFAKRVVDYVRPLMNKPEQFPLGRVYWLELLASIIYLRKRLRLSDDATREKILQSKPALHPHFDLANEKLTSLELL
jgi:hypothetical protein